MSKAAEAKNLKALLTEKEKRERIDVKNVDTSKPHQVLVFGDKQYTSQDGVLEFQPTMHGFKLTVIATEKKESQFAPQERTVTQEIYLNGSGEVVAEFTNAQDWRVLRAVLDYSPLIRQ